MKIFVAGHNGMVGSSIVRLLNQDSSIEVLTINRNHFEVIFLMR